MRTVSMRKRIFGLLLFFCAVLVALPLFGQNADPPGRVARLSYMEGAVSFEPAGEDNWSQASLNYPLTTGDRLWTDKGARAELETGNIAMRMSEQTDLTTTNLTDQLLQLGLAQGSLRITAYDLRSGHEVEVDTPSAAVTILQPGSYRLDTYPDQNRTLVTVNRGEVQITGNGLNETLRSGQAVMLTGTDPVQASAVSVPAPDSFDEWCAQRDQEISECPLAPVRQSLCARILRSRWLREAGPRSASMGRSGIRRDYRVAGVLIVTDAGRGSSRGAGPGWTTRLGDSLPSTTGGGCRLECAGAGCPVR